VNEMAWLAYLVISINKASSNYKFGESIHVNETL